MEKLRKNLGGGGENLTTRIVIPTIDESGLDAHLAEHFGRAPYYTVVDLDENSKVLNVKTEANVGEHLGGVGHPHDHLLTLKPNVVIAFGMGPRGLNTLQNSGVTVLKANANTVREVTASFKDGELEELAEGCEHAHHH